MMKQTFPVLVLRLVLAAAMAAPLAANAIGVQSSTSVGLTFRDCDDPACGALQRAESILGGDPGGLSASASGSSFFYGFASAAVSLSGDIGAPVLRASATQTGFPLTRVSANSVALQRYTYQGTEVTQRTFGGLLGYSQFISPDTFSGISAQIDVFTMASDFFEVGDSPESNFEALLRREILFEPEFGSGYVSLGEDFFEDSVSTDLFGLGALSVPVTLSPGDSVWVWTLLQTPVVNGSTIDAANTFVTKWDDGTDLVPANVVPAPPAVWLLATGLAGLVGRRLVSARWHERYAR